MVEIPQPVGASAEGSEKKVIVADEIRVGPLVITHDGKGGAGIWIEGPRGGKGPLVAIFNVAGQAGVGLYGPDPKKAMPICLTVDADGKPSIQFCHDGKVKFLDLDNVPG